MRIVAVKKQKKHIMQVIFDDMTCIELDNEVFKSAALKTGDEISEEKADMLERKSDVVRCRSRALYYLERRDMSEKELFRKLKTAGFTESDINSVSLKLKELGLLDDRKFAEHLKERLENEGKSLREIKEKFYVSGIPREITDELITAENESEKLEALLKRRYSEKLKTEEGIKKAVASLARHGYRFSDIREALKKLSEFEFTEE